MDKDASIVSFHLVLSDVGVGWVGLATLLTRSCSPDDTGCASTGVRAGWMQRTGLTIAIAWMQETKAAVLLGTMTTGSRLCPNIALVTVSAVLQHSRLLLK